MKVDRKRVLITGVAAMAIGICAGIGFSGDNLPKNDPVAIAVQKGVKWLVSVQGNDGGWGQDGGETSYVRQGERLESNGNDVANTAVAVEALMHAGSTPTSGEYREALQRAVAFILKNVEQSPEEGLGVTNRTGTQIQRKLGPYIDTFLTSKLLAELDGNMGDARSNVRLRQNLQKCIAKVEKNQLKDGSWNVAGGWAPILGTSMASRSLFMAQQKGVAVSPATMAKVEGYTQMATAAPAATPVAGDTAAVMGLPRAPGRMAASTESVAVMGASAGVSLYQGAQAMEQLSRTDEDRRKNAKQIAAIKDRLSDTKFVSGFGSIGGEEFFSYLNISDSLHRTGGPEWTKWNGEMKAKILQLQNEDGTWAGHHCITGRVAVTSAAILTLLADRDPVIQNTNLKKK